jgi:hypothetical protein
MRQREVSQQVAGLDGACERVRSGVSPAEEMKMSKQKKKRMGAAEHLELQRRLTRDALLIEFGIQNDGAVYMIHPLSEFRIKERYPDAVSLRSLMLGHRKEEEFEKLNYPRREQLVLMLTGLTPEQIAELGGVRIFNQENECIDWEWKPEVVRS